MDLAEFVTLTFDGILLAAGAVSAVVAWKSLRGRVTVGIGLMAVALILLGIAHLSETVLGIMFDFVGEGPPEIVHRVLVLAGFSFLVSGFVSAGKELRREKDSLIIANRDLLAVQEDLRLSNEELKERNRQLLEARASAATDGLTGIFNHRTFQERVRSAIERADTTDAAVGLIMLDIDGFKRINDEFGHLEGDIILQQVVGAIVSVAPPETTYRYGGDEFAILLPNTKETSIAQLAEDVRSKIEHNLRDREATISIGWISYPSSASSAEELIYGADVAMYAAKSAGKNRVIAGGNAARPAFRR